MDFNPNDCRNYTHLIETHKAMLLHTLQSAYRKHCLGDDSIGWDELSEQILDCLCTVMGDEEFNSWLEFAKSMEGYEP
jgi:hypothetical protein